MKFNSIKYLISPMYVIDVAFTKPAPNPSKKFPANTSAIDVAL